MARAANTRQAILAAARDLVRAGGAGPSVGAIAARAGVSRLSVYHHFGSRAGVLDAVAAQAQLAPPPAGVREMLAAAAAHWAGDPPLFRSLPHAASFPPEPVHELASRLAAEDRLRPGCSIKEAEDVLAMLTAFSTFDRLHQDGRRSTHAVVEILTRLAGSILSASP